MGNQKQLSIIILAGITMASTSGCAMLPHSDMKETSPSHADAAEVSPSMCVDMRGINEDELFTSKPLFENDTIPDVLIQSFSVSNATFNELMRTILAGTSISFAIDAEHQPVHILNGKLSAKEVSGSLKNVLDMFGDSVGFNYTYKDSVITISKDRQYIAKIPPVKELFDNMPLMLKAIGATDVIIDKPTNSIVYRATSSAQSKVIAYLSTQRKKASVAINNSNDPEADRIVRYVNRSVLAGKMDLNVALKMIRTIVAAEAFNADQLKKSQAEGVITKDAESSKSKQAVSAKHHSYVAIPPPSPERRDTWVLNHKLTLRDNIDSWLKLSGWNPVVWKATNDYMVTQSETLVGTLPEVMRQVAETINVNACIYQRSKNLKITDPNISCKL